MAHIHRQQPDPAFYRAIDRAAEVAEESLAAVQPYRERMIAILRDLEDEVSAADLILENPDSEAVQDALQEFRARYTAFRRDLQRLARELGDQLASSYAGLEEDSRFVTLLLFGRTRAGKSTTLEALTGGDGSTIGTGQQHTTTETGAYYFPAPPSGGHPDYPCLRIVDTPGIEGFDGDALAEMAESFVERSDHIFFLLTDDPASSGELERFGSIRTQGKDLTVLFNVKSGTGDLDLLLEMPETIFRPVTLDQHRRSIERYLSDHFDMEAPTIIPFHADAAWRARSERDLPDGISNRAALEDASGFARVEERIRSFVENEAIIARRKAPRDLLNSYLQPLKNCFHGYAQEFRASEHLLEELTRRFSRGTERARRRVAGRFTQLRARFHAVDAEIPDMVDSIIRQSGNGRMLDRQWQQLLADHDIRDSVEWFVERGKEDFRQELDEVAHVAVSDFRTSSVDDMGDVLGGLQGQQQRQKWARFGRAALRTLGTAGAGSVALRGMMYASNPAGWIGLSAAAAAAGVAAWGGSNLAGTVADKWSGMDREALSRQRSNIIRRLRERLWDDYRCARKQCDQWLDRTQRHSRELVQKHLDPGRSACNHLYRAACRARDELENTGRELNDGYLKELMAELLPEYVTGDLEVCSIQREPGTVSKLLLKGHQGVTNPIGACIGPGGKRIRKLRDALGGERIHLVDGSMPLEARIHQALGMRHLARDLGPDAIQIERTGNTTTARVHASGRTKGRLIGAAGSNVRLASDLLGVDITIGEQK